MNARLISSALLAVSFLSSGAAMAADTLYSTAAPQGEKTVRAMFAFADQNKDGQLTRAEARGHLPLTFNSFDSIDTARRGWISYTQFVDFTNQRVGKQADDLLKIGQSH